MSLTTDPNDPKLKEGQKNENGQHKIYLVLSEEERSKGFTRPYRDAYVHVGKKIEKIGEVRPLEEGLEGMSDNAKNLYSKKNNYVAFLKYPKSNSSIVGKFITKEELEDFISKKEVIGGCGTVTKMGRALSETYAIDPKFYGKTFCVGCDKHLPVEEFTWEGTNEIVGS